MGVDCILSELDDQQIGSQVAQWEPLLLKWTFSHIDTIKLHESIAARQEFQEQPVERFLNKNYYNPEYMYNTEGPEILRIYSDKDNTPTYTFTDVLDSAYGNVSRT